MTIEHQGTSGRPQVSSEDDWSRRVEAVSEGGTDEGLSHRAEGSGRKWSDRWSANSQRKDALVVWPVGETKPAEERKVAAESGFGLAGFAPMSALASAMNLSESADRPLFGLLDALDGVGSDCRGVRSARAESDVEMASQAGPGEGS